MSMKFQNDLVKVVSEKISQDCLIQKPALRDLVKLMFSQKKYFKNYEYLSSGAFALVLKAQNTQENRAVALKFLSSSNKKSKNDIESLKKEYEILQKFGQSQFLVNVYDCFYLMEEQEEEDQDGRDIIVQTGEKAFFVMEMELCQQNLKEFFNFLRKQEPPKEIKEVLAIQMIEGLNNLHVKNIMHRNIKPQNFLVCPSEQYGFTIKLCDLGFASAASKSKSYLSKKGTDAYFAPEVEKGQSRIQSDLYSLGLVLLELDNLKTLNDNWIDFDTKKYLFDGKEIPQEKYQIDKKSNIYKIAQICLKPYYMDRTTAGDLLSQLIELHGQKLNFVLTSMIIEEQLYEQSRQICEQIKAVQKQMEKQFEENSQTILDNTNDKIKNKDYEGKFTKVEILSNLLKSLYDVKKYSNNFHILSFGAFEMVLATQKVKLDHKEIVLKIQKIENEQEIQNEISIMQQLKEPLVVQLYDSYIIEKATAPDKYAVFELERCSCSLEEYLDSQDKNGEFTEDKKLQMAIKIIDTVNYIHYFNILHRDIKPDNFLVNLDGDLPVIKLCNFSLSAQIPNGQSSIEELKTVGNQRYLAPEIFNKEDQEIKIYSKKSDSYSVGLLLALLDNYLDIKLEHTYGFPLMTSRNFEKPFEKSTIQIKKKSEIYKLIDLLVVTNINNRALLSDIVEKDPNKFFSNSDKMKQIFKKDQIIEIYSIKDINKAQEFNIVIVNLKSSSIGSQGAKDLSTGIAQCNNITSLTLNLSQILVIENILINLCERVSQEATLLDEIDKNLLHVKVLQIQTEICKKQESRCTIYKISNIKFNHENFAKYLSKDLKDLKMYKNKIYFNSYGYGNYLPTALKNNQIVNHFNSQNQDYFSFFRDFSSVLDNLSDKSFSIKGTIQISQLIEDFVFFFVEPGFKGWCDDIDYELNINKKNKQDLYKILLKAAQVYYICAAFKYQKIFPDDKSEYDPNHFTQFVLTMFSLYAIFQELIKTDKSVNLDTKNFTGSTKFNLNASLKNLLPQLSIPDKKWLNMLQQVSTYFDIESKQKQPIFDQYYHKFNDFDSQEATFYISLIQSQGQYHCNLLEQLLNDLEHGEQYKLYQMVYTSYYLPMSFQMYRDISFYARISLLYFEQQPHIYQYNSKGFSYSQQDIKLNGLTFSKFSSFNKKRYTDFYLSQNEEKYQQILLPIDKNLQYITENQVIGQQNQMPQEYTRKQFYSQYFIQLNENLKYIYLYTAIQEQQIQLDQIQENILIKQVIHKERDACSKHLQLDKLNDDKLSVKLITQLCKIGYDLNEKQSLCKLLFNLIEILNFLYNFVSQSAQQIINEFFVSIRSQIAQKNQKNNNGDFEFLAVQSAVCILTYQVNNNLNNEDLSNILDYRIQIENSFRMNQSLPFRIYYKIMEFILSEKCFFQEIGQNQLIALKKYITKKENHQIWQYDVQYNIYKQKQYTYNPIQGRILNNGFPISGLPNFILNSEVFQQFYKGVTILFDYKKSKFLGHELPSYKSINFKNGKIKIILLNSSNFIIQEKLEGSQEYETLITQDYMQDLPLYIKSSFSFHQRIQTLYDYWYLNNKILVKNRERQLQYQIDLVTIEIFSKKEQLYLIPFTNKFITETSLYSLFERFESTAYIYSSKTSQGESNPKQIFLYRLGLSFLFSNENLISNDYKGYQISQEQTLQTLHGLQNYLLIEKSQTVMDCKESLSKVIIPNHPIINTGDYVIKTDQKILNYPPYFTYDINEELGVLNSQTISGNIFLALLYYKQGDLSQDKLTQMNSYENCFKILSKAWQNQEYSDLEFNLLLQFFDSNTQYDQNLLEKCKQNYMNFNYLSQNKTKADFKKVIEKIFQNEGVVAYSSCADDIIAKLLFYRQNYDVSQYFQQLSECFDKFKFTPTNISQTKILNIQYSKANSQFLKRQINGLDLNQNMENSLLENKWLMEKVNKEEIQQGLNTFVEMTVEQLQDIKFPFDQDQNEQNLANDIIKSGYGQNFIQELKASYLLYSQKSNERYNLCEKINIQELKDYLIQKQYELNKYRKSLFQQVINNIIQLDDSNYSKSNIQLLRICRKYIIPNTSEILQSISNKKELFNINPQLSSYLIDDIQSKILQFLEIYTLLQQTNRVMQLIFELEESSKQQQIEEKDRLLQKLIQNMTTQRCYSINQYPEWLLFEFQNNILIREQQKELTLSLFNDKINSIYQLNMGEGKTSVILMLLCQMIANGKNIIRINCMESLYGIMQDILRNKFSDLLRKKIYILPFSRDIDFTEENILKLEKILSEIRDQKGVLLMTPEQRQCFQLKKQELLLEYLETKDADNVFDWRQHHFYNSNEKDKFQKSKQKFILQENQRVLKVVLEKLKYISLGDSILNYPTDKNTFFQAVQLQYQESNYRFFQGFNKFVYTAFEIFRKNSTKLKNLLNQKTIYFNKISENFSYVDILDESDEILRHGKELNYTLGSSMLLDGGCVRWEIPFLIFRSIFYDDEIIKLLENARLQKPLPLIYNSNFKPKSQIGGGICLIRFVDEQYFKDIIQPLLATKIYNVFKEKFDIRSDEITNIYENANYGNYVDFLLGKSINSETFIYNELLKQGQDILNSFLLAKAWLSHNLFYHVMSYRYRVEYGLSEKRQKEIAVPFKAKDQPSEKSEFSHPDIMIGFTILSYLYNGLYYSQFKSAILKLYHEEREDKNEILESWVEESQEWIEEYIQKYKIDKPNWLKSFKSFETEDETKMEIAFNCLSRNFKVVKYYLSSFTFPIHAKHYKRRITSNAHSLVSESSTKGFSGTDDKNDSMPETIIPQKIQSQLGTNGKLIHILSREINQRYLSKSFKDSKQFLDEVSLFIEKENNCYMLIDAGAVITEMRIVYFSDISNKVEVYLQNLQTIPFSTCYIDARQLFIYLDESHTRGSDFVLPITSIGILTLGKDMNKDKFMQAAMRLRDLDFKQSVVVWGSEEISSSIAKLNNINVEDVKTKHVIIWVTANTIRKNEKDLYPVTLLKFKEQIKNNALQIQKLYLSTPIKSLIFYIENHVHDEIEKLYQYSPQLQNTLSIIQEKSKKLINEFHCHIQKDELDLQLKNYILAQIKNLNFEQIINKIKEKLPKQIMTYDVNFDCDEENEQEVEEIQQQEQVVQTYFAYAQIEKQWDFNLIFEKDFIQSCLSNKKQYPSLFSIKDYFQRSSFQDLQQIKWNENIYFTQNFMKTVKEVDTYQIYQNEYFRPIGMFLIHNISQPKIILLSGFEADFIIKILEQQKQQFVCLMHIDDLESNPLITPRSINLVQSENLKNIFMVLKLINGQCYFKNEELIYLKRCLGLIQEDGLDSNIEKSNKIYEVLKQAQLVQNGQFSSHLLKMLNQNNKTEIINIIEKSFDINLFTLLRNILKNSIFDETTKSIDLLKIFSSLATIRGKANQFIQSTLKNMIQIKFEWHL
ncbi:hypothetical protein ABPG72_020344 [Tetrahymena utriculariae]